MKIAILFSLVFSLSSFAGVCNVKNYKDAIACLKKDSNKRYHEGELAHSVGVTRYKKGKEHFKYLTGKEVGKNTYVGVVQVHYDEDQLLYYTIKRGKRVKPVLVKEFNIVDMGFYIKGFDDLDEDKALEILSLGIKLTGSMDEFHLY